MAAMSSIARIFTGLLILWPFVIAGFIAVLGFRSFMAGTVFADRYIKWL